MTWLSAASSRYLRCAAGVAAGERARPDAATLDAAPAPWRSGYAAACKAVHTGSIPVGASTAGRKLEPAVLSQARAKAVATTKVARPGSP